METLAMFLLISVLITFDIQEIGNKILRNFKKFCFCLCFLVNFGTMRKYSLWLRELEEKNKNVYSKIRKHSF